MPRGSQSACSGTVSSSGKCSATAAHVASPTRLTTWETWMRDMIVRMNARNRTKAVSTRREARDTDSCGTNASASSAAPRTSRSTVRAYTNEATKTPSVHCVMRVDRKSCRIRGLNCLEASCMTTIVIEKTRPVTEIIALAMVPSTLRAPAGPPGKAMPIRCSSPPVHQGQDEAERHRGHGHECGDHPEGPEEAAQRGGAVHGVGLLDHRHPGDGVVHGGQSTRRGRGVGRRTARAGARGGGQGRQTGGDARPPSTP